jgi:hypothetical protein
MGCLLEKSRLSQNVQLAGRDIVLYARKIKQNPARVSRIIHPTSG